MQRVILHKTGENLHRNVWTFEWTYRSNDLDIHSVTNSWADSKVVVTRTKKTLDQESPPPQLMTFMFRRSDAYKQSSVRELAKEVQPHFDRKIKWLFSSSISTPQTWLSPFLFYYRNPCWRGTVSRLSKASTTALWNGNTAGKSVWTKVMGTLKGIELILC